MNETPTQNQEIAAAKTLDGVNIHLGFMAKALERVESNQRAMDVKIDSMRDLYITTGIFTEHLKVEQDHEIRIRNMENVVSDVATIKKLVYGMVSMILVAFIGGIIYLVFKP